MSIYVNTPAPCAICSRRVSPVDVLCPACLADPEGKAFLLRRDRKNARGFTTKHGLAMFLAAANRKAGRKARALHWLAIAKESR